MLVRSKSFEQGARPMQSTIVWGGEIHVRSYLVWGN